MRLPLVLSALALAAATAVPAEAAIYPFCGTSAVHAATGTTASCRTDSGIASVTRRMNAFVRVTVATGTVDATLTCTHAITGTQTRALRMAGPGSFTLQLTTRVPAGCVAGLTVVTDRTTAYAFSSYSPILEPDPTS